jgi:hypothetical protein
VGKTTAGQLV